MEKKIELAQESRRAFLKTAGQVAVTAPAVAMLLSATTKPASASPTFSYDDQGTFNDQCTGAGQDQIGCAS